MSAKALTYKASGVDIDAADRFIEKIQPFVKKTERPEVLSSIGHYAGLFSLPQDRFRNPVLVSSTDGVGTKVKLALDWDRLEGVGQDLVAMSANDILCLGAEPLFFLDYYATGRLDIVRAARVLKGVAAACQEIGCALLGGETAEMPQIYKGRDFDLAGFAVGVVERDSIIDGSRARPGDVVLGLASSGVHSNGFSLIRKIVAQKKLKAERRYPGLNRALADVLLEPTRLYIRPILDLVRSFDVHGLAHITGGGLVENLPRVFPETCRAVLRENSWERKPIFNLLQQWGRISRHEMYRVFNCGIGMAVILPAGQAQEALRRLRSAGEDAWEIGKIVQRKKGESSVEVDIL